MMISQLRSGVIGNCSSVMGMAKQRCSGLRMTSGRVLDVLGYDNRKNKSQWNDYIYTLVHIYNCI